MRGRFVLVIGICLIVAGGWWYHSHNASSEADAHGKGGKGGKNGGPVPVGIATLKTGDLDVYLNGLGAITPRNAVTVHTQISGELMQVLFHEGQMVKAGDLLARIDSRPYEAALEQAEGQMQRDQALLKEARIDLKRYQTLYKQDSISKQQLDTQASLVEQYEGAVKNDAGLIYNDRVQIAYTHIVAPISGRVGLRQVDPGNLVQETDANGIVVVTQLQPITVIFTLPEDNIPAVMEKTQGNIKLPMQAWDRANTKQLATGSLIAIDNEVDPTTGTVKFRGEFPNKDNALFPSQFVNVRLKLDTLKDVLLMPASAVQQGSKGPFVYLVKSDNTVTVQTITIGVTEGDTVQVTNGLKSGDMVVVDGSDNLREGSKIEIPEAKPATPPAQTPSDSDAAKSTDAAPSSTGHHNHKNHTNDE